MRIHFTDLKVQSLKRGSYYDTALPGFGVRVGKRAKTFLVIRNGKRTKLGRYPKLSLADARRKAGAILEDVELIEQATVSAAITEYLETIDVRPRTRRDYERLLRRHLQPPLGHRDLTEIRTRDILAITDKLAKTPGECRGAHRTMQSFFNWCHQRTYISRSPMPPKNPAPPRFRDRVLADDEIKKVWAAAGELGAFGRVVRICLLTALRRSEAAQIKPDWIKGDILTVPAAIAKNGRAHALPLPPATSELVKEFVKECDLPTVLSISWGKSKAKLDLLSKTSDWVLHDLRRTAASNLARLGTAIHVTEKILNHVSGTYGGIVGVYQRYAYEVEIKQALERYETWLFELVKLPTLKNA